MSSGHSHGHGHSHGGDEASASYSTPAPRPLRIALAVAVAPFLLVTVLGLVLLRPSGSPSERLQSPDLVVRGDLYDATVVKVVTGPCGQPVVGDIIGENGQSGSICDTATVRLDQGPEEGKEYELPKASAEIGPRLSTGQGVVVSRVVNVGDGTPIYGFADLQRRAPLVLLALLFAAIVIGVARLRGLAALVGLLISAAILLGFVIPSILDGRNAVAVGLVGSSAIVFVILYVAHGFNVRTTTALLGTLGSLVLTAALAVIFVAATQLTGQSEEAATTLQVAGSRINLPGLILAGILIGTVGVLNDVTVTQASTAWEIHFANPTLGPRKVFVAGMRVGRDHIASVVDTLFLAYAGAALPLLILFTVADQRFLDVLTSETVAKEIVGTLVGSIGLVASVPVTTALAAYVASRVVVPGGADDGGEGPDARVDAGVDAGSASRRRPSAGPPSRTTAPAVATTTERKQRRPAAPARSPSSRRRRPPAEDWVPPKAEREFWDPDT